MSVYNHRSMVPPNSSRLLELLEAVKLEYDHLTQEAIIMKTQRDEYEHKGIYSYIFIGVYVCVYLYYGLLNDMMMLLLCIVNSQIQEMNMFHQTLADLERTQQMIKKQLSKEL